MRLIYKYNTIIKGRDLVRNNFFAVAQKFSLPGLATKSVDLVPAPSFKSRKNL